MDDITVGDSGEHLVHSVASGTPLTNRGSVTPKTALTAQKQGVTCGADFVGFDYLRMTIWGDPELVIMRVQNQILERYLPDEVGTFVEHGPVGRLVNRWTCGVPSLTVEQADDWTGLTLKGQACAALGQDAVMQIAQLFPDLRCRASRVDLAWDGFPMTTRQVFDILKRGDVLTRSVLDPHPIGDLDADPINGKGSTVYTHSTPEKRGLTRYCRWYDMRGPVRCELVLRQEFAAQFVESIISEEFSALLPKALGALRGFIDLLEPGECRVDRRPLHPLWAEFIDNAKPWKPERLSQAAELEGLAMIGRVEAAIQRASRILLEAADAFGMEWVGERLEYHGRQKVHLSQVEKLKSIRSSCANKRIAGVHPWPESINAGEVPF